MSYILPKVENYFFEYEVIYETCICGLVMGTQTNAIVAIRRAILNLSLASPVTCSAGWDFHSKL